MPHMIKNALNTIHCHMQTGKTDQIKTPNERFTKEKISSIPNEYSGIRTNVKNLVITFSILLRFCFSFNNSRTRTGSSFMILSTPKSTYWLTSSLGLRDQIFNPFFFDQPDYFFFQVFLMAIYFQLDVEFYCTFCYINCFFKRWHSFARKLG